MKKKNLIYLILLLVIFCISVIILLFNRGEKVGFSNNIYIKSYKDKNYYIMKNDYSGEYDIQYKDFSNEIKDVIDYGKKQEVMSYYEYVNYCNKYNLEQKYYDSNNNYIVFTYGASYVLDLKARLAEVEYINNEVNLYIWDDVLGDGGGRYSYTIVIPTEKDIDNVNVISVITEEEFDEMKSNILNPYVQEEWKPIIYLYPEREMNVEVKLKNDYLLTTTYPKYENSWNVLAKPNGDLIDLKTNRNLYALYYENKMLNEINVTNEGFVIKGEETIKFLEEKLAILGLNDREMEEFIIYWLPKLEKNKYNYIRFASEEEINNNMPLEVNPKPDTVIRILMTFKELDNPINVNEQQLNTPSRNGFTVVEWGGTEIK